MVKTLFIVAGCFFILPAFTKMQHVNKNIFEQFYSLEGQWLMKTAKGYTGEEWKKINKEYLQNRGFIIKGNDTIITERVALKKTRDGIFYTSTVENENNRQPV